jgi:hypothetical protein
MDAWEQRTLFTYTPSISPSLTFIYEPLGSLIQAKLHRHYEEFSSTLSLMKSVFAERMVLFTVYQDPFTQSFAWPDDFAQQEGLFTNLPNNVILEVGASILGWRKSASETSDEFVDRIVKSMQDSLGDV